MIMRSVQVRVPATVGNFQNVSTSTAALEGSLNVKATLRDDGQIGIRYFGENGVRVPRGRSNLVVRAMESALRSRGLEFTGADFEIYSSVPVGVGLGSSTAAVLAGLIAADHLFDLGLDDEALFGFAAIHESRADNVKAAWLGGLVSGKDGVSRRSALSERLVLNVVIPQFGRLDTPFASADDKDVPGLEAALNLEMPGVSIFLCGSGPAVGIIDQDLTPDAVRAVHACFAKYGVESRHVGFRPSITGARVWNEARAEAAAAGQARRKPSLIPV
ncbi:MAG: hypothetical protein DMG25_16680 [Acidobacteria bacterium]|nr:MAG: hypothetical protein DMG25_16680 [Acidobacteriota bacterium]